VPGSGASWQRHHQAAVDQVAFHVLARRQDRAGAPRAQGTARPVCSTASAPATTRIFTVSPGRALAAAVASASTTVPAGRLRVATAPGTSSAG